MTANDIETEARKHKNVSDFLPENRDMHKCPKQFLINIAYTVAGKPIAEFVNKGIVRRNEELAKKQNLLIDMDP